VTGAAACFQDAPSLKLAGKFDQGGGNALGRLGVAGEALIVGGRYLVIVHALFD
jgi:hypothetical protein